MIYEEQSRDNLILKLEQLRDKNHNLEKSLQQYEAAEKPKADKCPHLQLLENAPVGIFTSSAKGRLLSANPAMVRILGAASEKKVLEYYTDLGTQLYLHPYKRDEYLKLLKENSLVTDFEFEARTIKGITIWLGLTAKVTEHKNNDDFIITGFATDISERKNTEAKQKLLLAAIEQMPEAIMIADQKGNISYVNPAFETVSGYTREEVIGQNPRILKSGEQDDSFYQHMWETLSKGKNWKGRLVNKRKDGTFYTVEANISPFYNEVGKILHYVATTLDMTEEVRREEQYRQAQKMEAIGQLAGGVAHDFNNMLSVILGRAELRMKKMDPKDPSYAVLQEIQQAAQRSANLTQQLLAYARKQPIAPSIVDLNPAVEAILPILRRLAGENINLTWTPGEGSYPIKIDPVQLDQILTNLIVNARDAITNTGTISLESGKVSLDQAYCDRHAGFIPGTYIMLMVSDDGKGMDRETLSKVFEPFYTTKGLGQGTGLGLATVYGAIKQNQGIIDVYSESDRGTTFTIYLPNQQESSADKSAKSNLSIQKGHGETILFVEDESALLRIGEIMLQELGYEVLVANSTKEAIRLAEKYINEIDLLLTDIIMPGMNGKDLAKHLRTLNADLKVLFISGHPANIISEQGTLDGNINFLQKPFLMKELAANLRDSLEK